MPVRSDLDGMPGVSGTMPGLAGGARSAWAWWIAELAAMIPSRARGLGGGGRASIDLWLAPDETRVERVADGIGQRLVDPRPLAELDEAAWQELGELAGGRAIRVILLPPDIYVAQLSLPRRAAGQLRQAVALQLGEISPIMPDLLRWTAAEPRTTADRIDVAIAMARADRIDAVLSTFAEHGLAAPQIMAEVDGRPLLLEAAARERLALPLWRSPWLIALALLASIPVTTIAVASLFAWMDERTIGAIAPHADEVLRQERHARAAEQLREALAPIVRETAASRILNELAGRLPKQASLVDAERDSQGRLMLTIDAADPESVRDALAHDPLFRFDQVNETAGDDGVMRMTYRGRSR